MARGSSSSSPLDGGAPPFEMPGTSRVTNAPPAEEPGTTRALGAVALVGCGRAVPDGGGSTVAGESNSPPEDPGLTQTFEARPHPGAGRTSMLAESQRGGVGAHPSPLDGQRPDQAPPFGLPRLNAVGSLSGTMVGGIPAGLGSSRSVDALSLKEEERRRRDLQRTFGATQEDVARAQWQRATGTTGPWTRRRRRVARGPVHTGSVVGPPTGCRGQRPTPDAYATWPKCSETPRRRRPPRLQMER